MSPDAVAKNNSSTFTSQRVDPSFLSRNLNVIDIDFDCEVDVDEVEESHSDLDNWLLIKAKSINNYNVFAAFDCFEPANSCSTISYLGDCADSIVSAVGASYQTDSVGNYSVCASILEPSTKMLIPVHLGKFDEFVLNSSIDSHALLDSGASTNLISEALVLASKIPVVKKLHSYNVVLADNSVITSIVFKTIPIWLRMGPHKEKISFDVMNSLSYPLIIGFPWLRAHNPFVDWVNRYIDFQRCKCIKNSNVTGFFVDSSSSIDMDCASVIRFGEGLEDEEVFDDLLEQGEDSSLPKEYLEFKDVFSAKGADILPEHRKYDCEIILKSPDAVPPFRPIFNLSESDRIELKTWLEDMKAQKKIRESKSPAGAGVFFVPKKDKTKRLCVDYRWLNELTVRNSFPLPLISDLIDRLRFAKVFTKIDLRGAYNLVRIKPGDEWKTAFRCVFGHFEFTVMPFGLMNAPAVFQSMMMDIFRDILDVYVIVYIDDLLIFSASVDDHVSHVREVLRRLRDNRLYAKLSKCVFHSASVEFLGFIISGSGISMAADKVSSILDWPVPTKVRDVQSFLGFVNFYRKFIRDFSSLAAPLTELTKKDVSWLWSDICQNAFVALKDAVASAPCLSHPQFDLPFILETDASNFAVGAVLSQPSSMDKLEDLLPVGFFSRKMSPSERNYDVHDKELLAIICALDHWSHYFLGAPHELKIFTDHRNLVYFRSRQTLSPRLLRWSMFLNQFSFVLMYRKGSTNIPADLLSRRVDFVEEECESLTASNEQILLPDKFWKLKIDECVLCDFDRFCSKVCRK